MPPPGSGRHYRPQPALAGEHDCGNYGNWRIDACASFCAMRSMRLKTEAQVPLAEGSAVRRLARRALPMLGAGLALLTVAAARPVVPEQRPQTGLAVAFARLHDQILPWGSELPGNIRSGSNAVDARLFSSAAPPLPRLRNLLQADLLVVAPAPLPRGAATAMARLPGVVAAQQVDAARIQMDGKLVAMLGVN